MGYIELLLIAIGLSADAFAVSVTNGMCMKNIKISKTFLIAITFGVFQGIMPVIGFALGNKFTEYITKYDHIIALILLGIIGGKMLLDGIKGEEISESCKIAELSLGALLVQGIATSIDALAVGVSFAAMNVNIVNAAAFICSITFCLSFLGVKIGKKFGSILNNKAEIIGGAILIIIGAKIFIEHPFFI